MAEGRLVSHQCEVCHQLEGEVCKFCGVVVCEGCAPEENHNEGDFKCNSCQKNVCKSYLHHTEDEGEGEGEGEGEIKRCWFCCMKLRLAKLGAPVANNFLALMDKADQELDETTILLETIKIALGSKKK
jgi:hypothetical protein